MFFSQTVAELALTCLKKHIQSITVVLLYIFRPATHRLRTTALYHLHHEPKCVRHYQRGAFRVPLGPRKPPLRVQPQRRRTDDFDALHRRRLAKDSRSVGEKGKRNV